MASEKMIHKFGETKVNQKMIRFWFKAFTVISLGATGIAKIIMANSSVKLLEAIDPLLGINYHELMWGLGILEISVLLMQFFIKAEIWNGLAVAWLSGNFLIYKVGLWFIGFRGFCPCLGQLADALKLSPKMVNQISTVIAMGLFVGSVALLALGSFESRFRRTERRFD